MVESERQVERERGVVLRLIDARTVDEVGARVRRIGRDRPLAGPVPDAGGRSVREERSECRRAASTVSREKKPSGAVKSTWKRRSRAGRHGVVGGDHERREVAGSGALEWTQCRQSRGRGGHVGARRERSSASRAIRGPPARSVLCCARGSPRDARPSPRSGCPRRRARSRPARRVPRSRPRSSRT